MSVRALSSTNNDVKQQYKMQKFIILLLAVCLVSVHAFVKSDAPATEKTPGLLDNELSKQIQEGLKKFTENFNLETIQKGFSDAGESISKTVHAFVKRDAPATEKTPGLFDNELSKQIQEGWNKFTENVNLETIQKGFSDAGESISKTWDSIKPTEVPKA